MTSDVRRLVRWLQRARPPREELARALASGLVATTINVALLVGAVALLVESAARPGLHAVLGALIVIELFAFLRSPLRYVERLSAHRLGFAAVTRWRRWLVHAVGRLDYSRWRAYAAGDLLERGLRDIDELQDLWLRCVIPAVTSGAVMVIGDVAVGLLPPRGRWTLFVLALVAVQAVGLAALCWNFGGLVECDRTLREARSDYLAQLVELSAVTPELTLLGRSDFATQRSARTVGRLLEAERGLRRRRQVSHVVVVVVALGAVAALAMRPGTSPVWTVVAAMVALATYELLNVVRASVDTAVAVSAGAQRLEELDGAPASGEGAWPHDETLRLEHVSIREGGLALVGDASLVVAPGRRVALTGASGTGKSTLLRTLDGLDHLHAGLISIGGVPIEEIDEDQLRRHVTYVPSEPGLLRGFVLDVVLLGRRSRRDAVADLAALGLTTTATSRWEQLSRGEGQRVAVVRALATSPAIYLLDEPTSGLGRSDTAAVLSLLASTGATVVVATHDDQVIEWCDEVVELRDALLHAVSR